MSTKTKDLLKELRVNPFLLAPMAGITDHPFRSFMREMGCGLVTTELISAKSLQTGNEKSHKLMSFDKSQRPIGIQIFGEELSSLSEAAKIVEQSGANFIDLNFGCPVSKIVKKGAGSAVLKDLVFLRKILQAVKKAVSIPVSIKVRTGWDHHSRNTPEIANIAYNEGIIWLTIHGRTRAQAYSGYADWDYIAKVKKQSPLPVIGNGDLVNSQQILKLKKESACDGMMIGRGCLKNPWIFQEVNGMYKEEASPPAQPAKINQASISAKTSLPAQSVKINQASISAKTNIKGSKKCYMDILNRLKYHLENFYDEKMFLLQYKKFSTWYSSGYPESARFRQAVFQSRSKKEVLDRVESYFQEIDFKNKQDMAYEPALMQGHG